MLRPAHWAVCCRGNDIRNLVVQVYGCWERHGVPSFIVNPLRTYKSPRAAGIRCAIIGYEGDVREGQTCQQNRFDERLRLRFREWCVDGGGRRASLRVPMFGLQQEILNSYDSRGT
jgi:hypothetical protein